MYGPYNKNFFLSLFVRLSWISVLMPWSWLPRKLWKRRLVLAAWERYWYVQKRSIVFGTKNNLTFCVIEVSNVRVNVPNVSHLQSSAKLVDTLCPKWPLRPFANLKYKKIQLFLPHPLHSYCSAKCSSYLNVINCYVHEGEFTTMKEKLKLFNGT